MHGPSTNQSASKFTLATDKTKDLPDGAQPAEKSPVTFKSWKEPASRCTEQSAQLRKMWLEPDWATFKLRSKTYLKDHVKAIPEPPLFELVWFEIFKGDHSELLHIASSKKSFAQKALAKFGKDVPQLFVVSLIIPGSPLVATVQYFALKKELSANARINKEPEALWKKFLNGDDAFRKERFKLVPNIPEGPWLVKKSVGNKPAIISHGLESYYYSTPQYLEVVVDVSSDRVAKHVAALARSQSTTLKVDIGFVVEGRDEAELPEALLGCVQYDHLDLGLAPSILE